LETTSTEKGTPGKMVLNQTRNFFKDVCVPCLSTKLF
jgi:hypothetical protein